MNDRNHHRRTLPVPAHADLTRMLSAVRREVGRQVDNRQVAGG